MASGVYQGEGNIVFGAGLTQMDQNGHAATWFSSRLRQGQNTCTPSCQHWHPKLLAAIGAAAAVWLSEPLKVDRHGSKDVYSHWYPICLLKPEAGTSNSSHGGWWRGHSFGSAGWDSTLWGRIPRSRESGSWKLRLSAKNLSASGFWSVLQTTSQNIIINQTISYTIIYLCNSMYIYIYTGIYVKDVTRKWDDHPSFAHIFEGIFGVSRQAAGEASGPEGPAPCLGDRGSWWITIPGLVN